MKILNYFTCFVLFSFCLFAKEDPNHLSSYTPYFVGTILEYPSSNQSPGQTSLQYIMFGGPNYGAYNNGWAMQTGNHYNIINSQLWAYIGITNYLQFEFQVAETTTFFKGKNTTHFGPTVAGLGFQFMWDEKGTPKPNLRIDILETFPTGKHQNLSPYFETNDATGNGSYETSFVFVVQKNFWTIPNHAFNINASLAYTYLHKTNVHGLNVYGGATNTRGKVWPGDTLIFTLSSEYLFIQTKDFELGLALDTQYTHTLRTKFHGFSGTNSDGSKALITHKSKDLFSILPALEIAFSPNLAVYIGAFFSITGRNTNSFAQGVFSIVGTF